MRKRSVAIEGYVSLRSPRCREAGNFRVEQALLVEQCFFTAQHEALMQQEGVHIGQSRTRASAHSPRHILRPKPKWPRRESKIAGGLGMVKHQIPVHPLRHGG